MPTQVFQRLGDTLRQASPPAVAKPNWPLPEGEMIARYGLRLLTPTEQQYFPGLRLVLRIDKVLLAQPLAVVPRAKRGWVVWLAETYPGCYLVRLPGGAALPVSYNKIAWTAVSCDEPATTVSAAKAMEQQHRWQTAVLSGIRQSLQL
ncbi:MAG: hypothetical protein R3E31_02645 [Chloroflexota bacterium]